jgi:hypothetical protein
MIRYIHDVRELADGFVERASTGTVLAAVVLIHKSDGTFETAWTSATEESMVSVVGQLEFLKRDLMACAYGA